MRKEFTYCDHCNDLCEHYIEIKSIIMKAANGKRTGTTIGYSITQIIDKLFCSINCLMEYCKDTQEFKREGLFIPGEQVGHPKAGNQKCGK